MHSRNQWGGTLEVASDSNSNSTVDNNNEWDRASLYQNQIRDDLDEMQQSWLLQRDINKNKNKYVDLGCIVCSRKALRWSFGLVVVAFLVIGLPVIIAKVMPKHKAPPPVRDNYTIALHKALLFFNAQKSGKLPKNNGVSWRGDSGLKDGSTLTDVKGGLVGGYYDAGDNTKFHFPMSFAMTMLSWSLIEYEHKYKDIGEYDHVRDLIKWGTDYLLLTFNSSSSSIDHIYSQVGGSRNGSTTPDDHNCWERPEEMDYPRPIQTTTSGPDLAGEMAAALAAASIVFRDNTAYSKKLVKGARNLYVFARDSHKQAPYSRRNLYIENYYNSSGYFDEYMWSGAWLYYATGNVSYLALATDESVPQNARAFFMVSDLSVLSWDNKLPAAMLLLTRLRVFLDPGYPYEDMLRSYHNVTELNMCSYLQQFNVFNWTRGGLIQLNHGKGQNLQYVTNAAFLASLFVDYMNATAVPGWQCGPDFISLDILRNFATSQMDYILGANPLNMSYVVGYGSKYPRHIHHRGASIPKIHKVMKNPCRDGFKWLHTPNPDPNIITGALVGGPDKFDKFKDVRSNYSYTEATIAGNAGLVAALVSLTTSGGVGIDKNSIFSGIPPLFPTSPPPPPPWKPGN